MPDIMVRVDDTNLTRWDYSNEGHGWRAGGDSQAFNSTGHSTVKNYSQMKFRFNGTFVQLVGYILPYMTKNETSIPRLSFSLDNMLFDYSAPSSVQATLYNQTFFNSITIPDREHELTVIYTQTDSSPLLWLDYIDYTPSHLDSENTPNDTSALKPSPTGQPSSNANSLPVGAIAGSSVAAFMTLVITAVLGILWWRRRKRRIQITLEPFNVAKSAVSWNGPERTKEQLIAASIRSGRSAHATSSRPPRPPPPPYHSGPQGR